MIEIFFRSPDFKYFKSQLIVYSDWISSEMEDLLTSFLLESMVTIPSGIWGLTISTFQLSLLTFSRVSFPELHRFLPHVLLAINGLDLLWVFDIQDFGLIVGGKTPRVTSLDDVS
jgi:hypothetical protein